jgi:hypothetical protein
MLRELLVIVTAFLLAALTTAIGRFLPDGVRLMMAILVPIAFCLGRAAFFPSARRLPPGWRRVVYSLLAAAAVVLLWLFEMSVGLLLGAAGIPAIVWLAIAAIGCTYVVLIGLARRMIEASSFGAVEE